MLELPKNVVLWYPSYAPAMSKFWAPYALSHMDIRQLGSDALEAHYEEWCAQGGNTSSMEWEADFIEYLEGEGYEVLCVTELVELTVEIPFGDDEEDE